MRINQVTATGKKLTDLLPENSEIDLQNSRLQDGVELPFHLTFTNQDSTENVYIENMQGHICDESNGSILYPMASITLRTRSLDYISLATEATKTNSNVRVIST